MKIVILNLLDNRIKLRYKIGKEKNSNKNNAFFDGWGNIIFNM